ncbi:MAG TPA: phosphatidylglycerophosphatase A [Rhizomicrobium sp.]|jgi:phosphatidylglycerophosphatase A|nr:phosphatidylglycerophosphatase A [Rhizomicrobium sp.]
MKIPRASAVVSSVFGIGYFPAAQGTIMSAITVPIAILLAVKGGGYIVVAGTAIIVLVVGILSCSEHVRETGNTDPSECVIDELAGQLLACSFVAFPPFSLPAFFLSFALFRLFDIWKPWPVSWAETELHGGLAVMMDDIVAGLMAGCLAFAAHYFHWL